MAKKATPDPGEVVKAFRKAAKDLGCHQSEQRFQDTLFIIGRTQPGKGRRTAAQPEGTTSATGLAFSSVQ